MGKKRVIKKGGEADAVAAAGKEKPHEFGARKKVISGIAHILATYNNTLISITDEKGNAIAWSSAGSIGFSGTRKATPFAAARVAEGVAEKALRVGMENVTVRVSGVGSGRDSAIRALANHGLNIISIKDHTPLPHNGPRAKKARRV